MLQIHILIKNRGSYDFQMAHLKLLQFQVSVNFQDALSMVAMPMN